jgi:copper chaperone CopZ
MALTTIAIDGMSCAGCVASVTAVLKKAGVAPREVGIGRATIEFEEQNTVEKAIAALERQGFSAHIESGSLRKE